MNVILDATPTRAAWLGTGCCLLAALCYTGANICLRQLAAIKMDPSWVICVKETVSVAVVGPWLLWQIGRGRFGPVPRRAFLVLVLAGLGVQLGGNLSQQAAFGVVGLAICMPVAFGVMLAGSAVIDAVVFRESLPVRSLVAVSLVIASIALLSVAVAGQGPAPESSATASHLPLVLLGMMLACLTGIAFAGLGGAIRFAAGAGVPVAVTVVVVTGTGMISLGLLSLLRLGPATLLATDRTALAWMIASGLFNLAGFALITKGLQLTTLVHANVLNASQVALGAAAGILLFHEPYNAGLLCGIALTVAGITLFGHPRLRKEAAGQPP